MWGCSAESLRPVAAWISLGALITACCYLPAPPSGGGAAPQAPPSSPPPPPPTPTLGHSCRLRIDVYLPRSKPSGEPWDVGGGAPDPFAIVRQDGVELARTQRVQDSRSAHWELTVACDHTRSLEIEVLDGDVSLDDSALDIEVPAESDYGEAPFGEGTVQVERG